MIKSHVAQQRPRSVPDLAIIADDLTGALDSAAPFAMRGIPAAAAVDIDAIPTALGDAPRVIGISTDSRETPPDVSRERVRAAIAALPAGISLFKKVDSRLKGNIAAELDAISYRHCLVVPAIPAFGRRTRGGLLFGFGIDQPIDIATRLGRHSQAATIPDTSSQEEIEHSLSFAHDLHVGARGLAEALAVRMEPAAHATFTRIDGRNALVVIGSTDDITIAQLDYLRAARTDLKYIPAPNGIGRPTDGQTSPITVIQATPGSVSCDATAVAKALAETVSLFSRPPASLLVLSGGATAQVILIRLGLTSLVVAGEALPGLPVARSGSLTIVTKSGGFGEVDTLERLLALVKDGEP